MSVEGVAAPQAAPEATSQPEATSEKISAKLYAELARKEKALRAKEESWKSQLAEKEQGWLSKEQEYQQKYMSKDKLLSDPLGALQEAGMSYDQILQLAMNPPSQERIMNMQLETRIKELEAKLENKFSTYEEGQKQAQAKQYEQALGSIKNEVKSLVAKDAETYELIAANGPQAQDLVVTYIEEMFRETGRVPSTSEAAEYIENYLLEETLKTTQLNKIKNKLAPQQATPQVPGKPQAKTLTNTNTQPSQKPMSPRDRALAAFYGQKL